MKIYKSIIAALTLALVLVISTSTSLGAEHQQATIDSCMTPVNDKIKMTKADFQTDPDTYLFEDCWNKEDFRIDPIRFRIGQIITHQSLIKIRHNARQCTDQYIQASPEKGEEINSCGRFIQDEYSDFLDTICPQALKAAQADRETILTASALNHISLCSESIAKEKIYMEKVMTPISNQNRQQKKIRTTLEYLLSLQNVLQETNKISAAMSGLYDKFLQNIKNLHVKN